MVEAFIAALRDLIKFKIISYVNTGDKTQDNMINALLLTGLTLIFANFSWKSILMKFRMWKNTKYIPVNSDTIAYYTDMIPQIEHTFNYSTWNIEEYRNMFEEKLLSYYISIYKKGSICTPKYYNFQTHKFESKATGHPFTTLMNLLKDNTYYPIFANQDGLVCIYRVATNSTKILIAYNSESTLNAFMQKIESINVLPYNIENKNDRKSLILDMQRKIIGEIYPDRNFDLFISKHKKTIIAALNAFQKANSEGADLNGYGTYNLGLIIHGEPGTGKTFLIKAIALYLKREIVKVDMRNIRTKEDFANLFKAPETCVICLDEFDCLLEIIKKRYKGDNSIQGSDGNQDLKELKTQQMDLMRLLTESIPKDSSYASRIEQELENVNKKISDFENTLTLESILTVLDGIQEHRNRIIIATTNHLDKIDDALLRPGRFDLHIHLGKFEDEEIKDMLMHMFKHLPQKDLDLISKHKFPDGKYTPVEVIHIARIHKNLPDIIAALN